MKKEESIYWDISEPLSFDALFNFIIGNRGGGKSYGCKYYAVKQWEKKGDEFVYIRRTKTELKQTAKTFFNDLPIFPEHNKRYINGEFQICEWNWEKNKAISSWQTVGYALALSESGNVKSMSFPKVKTIIFDEFILTPTGHNRYLTDEVRLFLELYETISRMRDCKCFFLANSLTVYNPYFLYFHLQMPMNKRKIKKQGSDLLVQIVEKENYIAAKKETRFGQLIEGSDYEQYAIYNNYLLDDNTQIKKKTGRCAYMSTISYKGKLYGMYHSYDESEYYISEDVDTNRRYIINTFTEKGEPYLPVIKNKGNYPELKIIIYTYLESNLFFESQTIKKEMQEMISRLM